MKQNKAREEIVKLFVDCLERKIYPGIKALSLLEHHSILLQIQPIKIVIDSFFI